MPSPINLENAQRVTKNYLVPAVIEGWDLTKKTIKVALGILACTAFVAGLGLIAQAYTSVALPVWFSSCLVREAIVPVTGSCLILGFMVTLTREIYDAFTNASKTSSEPLRRQSPPKSRYDEDEGESEEKKAI